jgi:hypothetical protein
MRKMIGVFKTDLESHTQGRIIKLKVIEKLKGLAPSQNVSEESDETTGGSAQSAVTVAQRQHAWVRSMDQFRRSLIRIHDVLGEIKPLIPEPVRIKVSTCAEVPSTDAHMKLPLTYDE